MELLSGCLNQSCTHKEKSIHLWMEMQKQSCKPVNLLYTKEVLTGSEFKPVNLFDMALVNEKQSGNKNITNINIFGCLSQNAISTGVA